MKARKHLSIPCVITQSASQTSCAELNGSIENEPKDCRVIDSTRRLLALGLSMQDIEDLGLGQSMLDVVSEYICLYNDESERAELAADAIEATLHNVMDEINKLDMELEMLNMRKRALKKRMQTLTKIARSLQADGGTCLAA